MPIVQAFSFTPETQRQVELLAELDGINKSETVRNAVSRQAIAKADEIVAKFFDNISHASDTSWLTIRNQAGELLQKRAELKFPAETPAMAMSKVADAPDAVDKTLYEVQAIKSQDHFAAYRTALASGGQ